jgi:hypothetical protein
MFKHQFPTTAEDFQEEIDLTVEPWATLAPLCWDSPSTFRLGQQSEKHGIQINPFTKPHTMALFEEGRAAHRAFRARTQPAPGGAG